MLRWCGIPYHIFIMKTFIKKTNCLLKKEAKEFYSDIVYICNGIIRTFKKLLLERYFILGILIGLILRFVF